VSVSADTVRQLRERTGAGMMECKKALVETGGDLEAAAELMRKSGLAKADKKASRVAAEGVIAMAVADDGKSAVLVEVNCETDFVARTEDFQGLVRDLALHIASAAPLAVSIEEVPKDVLEREREIYRAQAAESGKPEKIWDKMVEGKLKKFYEERVLLEQPFVKDDKQTVGQLVKAVSGKVGENVVVRRFARFQLGES
jgi:elongation factor Ts